MTNMLFRNHCVPEQWLRNIFAKRFNGNLLTDLLTTDFLTGGYFFVVIRRVKSHSDERHKLFSIWADNLEWGSREDHKSYPNV